MTINPDNLARSAPGANRPDPPGRTLVWTNDDAEALGVLKLGGALGLFFLLVYAIVDSVGGRSGLAVEGEHWALLAGTCLFFGMTWTRSFRRYWKFWTLVYCAFMMTMFVAISARTGDPESRFIAMLLCPLATASFVSWGSRWQLAMGAVVLVIFAVAEHSVPLVTRLNAYRWMGLGAALAFGQATAIFLERYRDRIRRQFAALEEAARFRETQISTMAHDISSPIAALTGYAQLLEEDTSDPVERGQILARIGSTAWNMNLVVSNVLDLYRIQEDGRFHPILTRVDLRRVITAASEDCAAEASRRGLEVSTSFAVLLPATLDGHHLDRIVRNLMAFAIARANGGVVSLRAAVHDRKLKMEVNAQCPSVASADLAALLAGPDRSGHGAGSAALGLFIARAMAESAGGSVEANFERATGLTLRAAIPIADGGGATGAADPTAP
ncbi:MAG: HAMP domain-containing sensor histidine kinase [Candidatus Binataceae bacterium]